VWPWDAAGWGSVGRGWRELHGWSSMAELGARYDGAGRRPAVSEGRARWRLHVVGGFFRLKTSFGKRKEKRIL
jgi:hypothetical protein